jgi:hypothetical protein
MTLRCGGWRMSPPAADVARDPLWLAAARVAHGVSVRWPMGGSCRCRRAASLAATPAGPHARPEVLPASTPAPRETRCDLRCIMRGRSRRTAPWTNGRRSSTTRSWPALPSTASCTTPRSSSSKATHIAIRGAAPSPRPRPLPPDGQISRTGARHAATVTGARPADRRRRGQVCRTARGQISRALTGAGLHGAKYSRSRAARRGPNGTRRVFPNFVPRMTRRLRSRSTSPWVRRATSPTRNPSP